MEAAPSPWQPPPDSDAGTFATQSVAMVMKGKIRFKLKKCLAGLGL